MMEVKIAPSSWLLFKASNVFCLFEQTFTCYVNQASLQRIDIHLPQLSAGIKEVCLA